MEKFGPFKLLSPSYSGIENELLRHKQISKRNKEMSHLTVLTW